MPSVDAAQMPCTRSAPAVHVLCTCTCHARAMHTRCACGAHAVRVRACSHRSSASTPNCAARLGQIAPRSLRFTQPSSASLSATTTSQVGYLSWCPASFHPSAAAAACFSASATTHAHSSALATPTWKTRPVSARTPLPIWPRLAEAGGRPELGPVLAGRVQAGRSWPKASGRLASIRRQTYDMTPRVSRAPRRATAATRRARSARRAASAAPSATWAAVLPARPRPSHRALTAREAGLVGVGVSVGIGVRVGFGLGFGLASVRVGG